MHSCRRSSVAAAVLAALWLTPSSSALADWSTSPHVNTVVAAAAFNQFAAVSTSDGNGGVIFLWRDYRSGLDSDLYAQRLDADGNPLWPANGVAVCTVALADQIEPQIVSDGSGGAIFAWADARGGNFHIFAQRIDASGTVQWTTDGISLSTQTGSQFEPAMIADGSGGAIVAWADNTPGLVDIFAQRIDASGNALWAATGEGVCTAAGDQFEPALVSDGAGGAIVTWRDQRGGTADIYAQHISSTAVHVWTLDGIAVCNAAGDQFAPVIVTDGVGGGLIGWQDARTAFEIYAGRVIGGASVLGTSGKRVSSANGIGQQLSAAPDGVGGVYFAWRDDLSSPQRILAQRMGGDGAMYWPLGGIVLATSTDHQFDPALVSHGTSGGIVAWADARTGSVDLYAQRFTATGVLQWGVSGAPVSIAVGEQTAPTIVTDGDDGAILGWTDSRAGAGFDIYAQQIERFGELADPAPVITTVADVPNDQGGQVLVEWTRSYLDEFPELEVDAYSVWRRAPSQAAAARGARPHRMTDEQGLAVYWEYLATQPAAGLAGYSYVASTTSDSIAGSNPLTSFQVMAEAAGGVPFWISAPDSGYSVDDLAPAPPAPFTGTYDTGVATMAWQANVEPDLSGYRLYRGPDLVFVPGPGNLVTELSGTNYADAAGEPYVYKLTAVDVHGNESSATTLVPNGALAVEPSGGVAFGLSHPAPNPTRGVAGTLLRFGLPVGGGVRLDIHDVQGRTVRVVIDTPLAAGQHAVHFDGRDAGGHVLAPGIYLARLEQDDRQSVRRLLIVP